MQSNGTFEGFANTLNFEGTAVALNGLSGSSGM